MFLVYGVSRLFRYSVILSFNHGIFLVYGVSELFRYSVIPYLNHGMFLIISVAKKSPLNPLISYYFYIILN